MSWAGPARWAGSPRWDDFYPTFIWNLLSHFTQKACYVAGKKLFDQKFFTINSDAKPSCRTNILTLFEEKNWLKKTLSHLAGLAHLHVFIRKIFISPWWDPGKIKWDPTKADWITFHMNTLYFYKSFLKRVRSHLGEPARLTGPLTSIWTTPNFGIIRLPPLHHLWRIDRLACSCLSWWYSSR